MSNNKKKGFSLPYPYIIIFTIMILVVILSYILPAGEYGTMINEIPDKKWLIRKISLMLK